jgi:hypothetical protein
LLDPSTAAAIARVALANVQREYPRRVDLLLHSATQEWLPRRLHPAFYGSYDWHSAVHMHWSLARLLRLYPSLPQAGSIVTLLDRHLAPQPLAAEAAFLSSPAGAHFERPYGWAWLLALQGELLRHADQRWAVNLQPLAAGLARRLGDYLKASPYPVRAGAHGNTAFACLLALDYARMRPDAALQDAVHEASQRWYRADRDAPLDYEPSLDDFLSPALIEALLMKEILPSREFEAWLAAFLPRGVGALRPPLVRDHADAKQSHLDGLCLSRAWCLRRLGEEELARRHLEAGMPYMAGGDYVGEHWLASFALLAMGGQP